MKNQSDQNRFCFSFQKKEYIVGKKPANNDETIQLNREDKKVKQLGDNVKRLEEELAAQYRIDFGGLFQQMPEIKTSDAKTVLDWVDTWTQYRYIARVKQSDFDAMIKQLEANLDLAKKQAKRYNDLTAQINALENLKQEGAKIVSDVDSVAVKLFGPSALSANKALSDTLHQTIDCIIDQVRKGA